MATAPSDLSIRQDVVDALTHDVRIDATNIDVDVVGGVCYLRGTVPSIYEKYTAAEIANRIRGVVDVVNELRVQPLVPRSDAEIAADIRAALIRDVRVPESKIGVNVINGVVTLTGTVDSYLEKSYAASDAWSVPGVIDVINNIVVKPVPVRNDEEIRTELRAALDRDVRIDASNITVDVVNGVVYLRGSVPTLEQKRLAEQDAWWSAGVRGVINELAVVP